ncbi:DEAD/DEAH box helicase family protein [Lysobacter sp. A378]
MTAPKSLIVNSPFEVPLWHWQDDRGNLKLAEGRRPAGYEIFDTRNNTRRTEPLEQVERIRERVDAWRQAKYPGITTVTRRLLEHWNDPSARQYPFYFCQIEAIETLIWWEEAPAGYKQGIAIPRDGGPWERLCSKMATGSGKTTVMAMLITWQVLNALAYPKRNKDFSRVIFIVAPGLTVRERLQVLYPGHPQNYYDAFGLCPNEAMRSKLNQTELLVENWHTLMPLKEQARSVVKKGAESDKAFVKRVLGKLAGYKDIVVINDEAHHAYRIAAEDKRDRETKRRAEEMGSDMDEATRWIEGLDRIHKEQRIQRCFDLSATPFAPTGRANTESGLFEWIVSDFGLNDAIEAGLVKTPRVVVRDGVVPDTKTLRPKLYHLYRDPEVQEDLNRRGAEPHEPLPQLVQQAYTLLGADWRQAAEAWANGGHTSPPVLLTVCNRTETAARIERYFTSGDVHWPELRDADRTLRVDSKVLEKAEIGEKASVGSLAKAKMAAIVDALCKTDTQKTKYKDAKKAAGKLRYLVELCGHRASEVASVRQWTDAKISEWLFNHAPLPKAQRDYFTSAMDYESRLKSIVEATSLPRDKKQALLELDKEELLREIVDNVGKRGTAGQNLQNVVSVAMLSEGWDAKNVTHIMGLRAFTSQLLCEQVIGRGLRRVGYDTEPVVGPDGVERQLFKPEFVNVFGVPLSVFQDIGGGDPPPPPKSSTQIESLEERNSLEIRWPNVLRVDAIVRHGLALDWAKMEPLKLDPAKTPLAAELAPALGGANAWDQITEIDLEKLPDEFRLQRLVFQAARKAYDHLRDQFTGTPEYLAFQLIRLIEKFLSSDRLDVPSLFHQEPLRKRILVSLNMDVVVQHLLRYLIEQNQERIEPVFDEEYPIGSTRYMRTWYTTRACQAAQKSQISHMVADGAWEAHAANVLETSKLVQSYAKNDHLGFQVYYMWNGAKRRYIPDFLLRLSNGKTLALEIKGEDSEQNKAKRSALDTWVKGVNQKGGFGVWCWDVAFEPHQIQDILATHAGPTQPIT